MCKFIEFMILHLPLEQLSSSLNVNGLILSSVPIMLSQAHIGLVLSNSSW